jgi:hypothetical protein
MPDGALVAAARMQFPELAPGDVTLHTAALEELGLFVSVTDELTGRLWTLTTAGQLKAAQLAG